MPSINPATWSAIAATGSAAAALLMWRIQRRNLHESVRPELVLTDFSRRKEGSGKGAHEVIRFSKIRNVGRGPALNIHMNIDFSNPPTAVLATQRIPILAPNETMNIDGDIIVWWKNVPPHGDQKDKFLVIKITMFCVDTGDMRHETRYTLMAIEHPGMGSFVTDEVAPGVGMGFRTRTTQSLWRIRLVNKVNAKIWVLILAVLIICNMILWVYLATQ